MSELRVMTVCPCGAGYESHKIEGTCPKGPECHKSNHWKECPGGREIVLPDYLLDPDWLGERGSAGYVKVLDPCATCNSSGDYNYDRERVKPCPDCGGRGWVPAEGVHLCACHDTPGKVHYAVPLSRLEVDDVL